MDQGFGMLRVFSDVLTRMGITDRFGKTFGGRRNVGKALGYKEYLTPEDYRARYERDGVAARVVDSFPKAMWRGGAVVLEDEDPDIETEFEKAWEDFATRLNVWSVLERADILAGLGQFAVVVIGAPGELDQPLKKTSIDKITYLQPYGQGEAEIQQYDTNQKSERFGLPEFYTIKRVANPASTRPTRVHWTRVLHITDGLLDDNVLGLPRMKRVWNRLDDLEKVVGGGSEAFWLRANAGTVFNLDPAVKLADKPGEKPGTSAAKMQEEVDKFAHGLTRILRTRGMEVQSLGSEVADFKSNAESIVSMISAATGIPMRILLGSERGELASSQDKDEWERRVQDRREAFGEPHVLIPLIERLILVGALSDIEYQIRWDESQDLDDESRANLAIKMASINKQMGKVVVTRGEIRDRILGWPPIEEVEDFDEEAERLAEEALLHPNGPDDEDEDEEETDDEQDAKKPAKEAKNVDARRARRRLISMITATRARKVRGFRRLSLHQKKTLVARYR